MQNGEYPHVASRMKFPKNFTSKQKRSERSEGGRILRGEKVSGGSELRKREGRTDDGSGGSGTMT